MRSLTIPKNFQAEAGVIATKISKLASELILPYLKGGVEVPVDVVMASVLLQCGDDLDKFKSMIGK